MVVRVLGSIFAMGASFTPLSSRMPNSSSSTLAAAPPSTSLPAPAPALASVPASVPATAVLESPPRFCCSSSSLRFFFSSSVFSNSGEELTYSSR